MQRWAGGEPYPKLLPWVGARGVLGTPVSSTHLAGVRTVHLFNWDKAQAARGPWGERKEGNIKIQSSVLLGQSLSVMGVG